jgi:hypothetical protein
MLKEESTSMYIVMACVWVEEEETLKLQIVLLYLKVIRSMEDDIDFGSFYRPCGPADSIKRLILSDVDCDFEQAREPNIR